MNFLFRVDRLWFFYLYQSDMHWAKRQRRLSPDAHLFKLEENNHVCIPHRGLGLACPSAVSHRKLTSQLASGLARAQLALPTISRNHRATQNAF
jgi:hypothetical protein